MKRPVFFLFCLLVVIIALSVVQVGISNRLSTTGIELAQIQKDIKKLRVENALLTEVLLTKSSYTDIAYKAEAEGFIEGKSKVYLSTPLPVAFGR